MRFDLFCSIAPTPVDGLVPDEATILRNFLEQAIAADELGFETLWAAESHYSVELQKKHRNPVVPHWQGEIGLNTDICQLAGQVFARTRRIEVGSAIMNIVGNGGPLPAAEKVATALSWHGLDSEERRRLHVGFAAGRFDYINRLTGVTPRAPWEELAWPQVRNAVFREAAEVFVRLLRGDELAADMIDEQALTVKDFRDEQTWATVRQVAGASGDAITVPRRWPFEVTKIIPSEWRRELLQLVAGSHDPELQTRLNSLAPVRVFNLSITPPQVIEATHERMATVYHASGGTWQRDYLPQTVFVFIHPRAAVAREEAQAALAAYWTAMEGTLDPAKVAAATDNALVGDPDEIARQVRERFHPQDRLMLWFDFFNHDKDRVIDNMTTFMTQVAPRC